MEEALLALLLADTALAGLVGDRIEWEELAKGTAMPAVVLNQISGARSYTFRGRIGLVSYLIQVDCWGATAKSSRDVSQAFRSFTDAFMATPEAARAGVLRGLFLEEQRSSKDPGVNGTGTFYRTLHEVRVLAAD